MSHLQSDNQLFIQAPPGAGKSTWLPLALLNAQVVTGKILLLEPRRVAARNIADFLAQSLDERLGQTIGLRMRGMTKVSHACQLEVVTEGVLTRMLQSDPELSGYDLILFDEFHERSLQADLAFALAYEVQESLRDDLKLVLMSATLDQSLAQRILPNAKSVYSDGRLHPVSSIYRPVSSLRTQGNPFFHTLNHIADVICEALTQHSGDVLVFMSGVGDINQLIRRLSELNLDKVAEQPVEVLPLHGQLSIDAQRAVLKPSASPEQPCSSLAMRRIIVSTNIAETSLTISGVKIVIDSGLHKRVTYDYKTGFQTLFSERISKASAEQRQGRAGRLESGVCYRMWPEGEHERLRSHYPAEIETADLAPVMLELLSWGAQHFSELNFPSLPSRNQIIQTQQRLVDWQLIRGAHTDAEVNFDELAGSLSGNLPDTNPSYPSYQLTDLGRQVTQLGLPPEVALTRLHNTESAHLLAAFLYEQTKPAAHIGWDLIEQLYAVKSQPRIKQLLQTWKCSAQHIVRGDILTALACVFPTRLAKKRNHAYVLSSGKAVKFSAIYTTSQQADYLCVLNAGFSDKNAEGVIYSALELSLDDVKHYWADSIQVSTVSEVHPKTGEVSFYEVSCIGEIKLDKSKLQQSPSTEQLQSAWLHIIVEQGFKPFKQASRLAQLMAKLMLAHQVKPDIFPTLIDEAVIKQQAATFFSLYLANIKSSQQLFNLNMINCITSGLNYQQQQWLEHNLPNNWQAPDGNHAALDYTAEQGIKAAIRIQSCYGLALHPTVSEFKIPLVLDLLSPARRPIQTTQDIVGFWQGSYKDVQKDMKSQYPKHFWPDSPQTEAPGTQTKRQRSQH